ncbi:hypothetical protein ABW20_dc0109195 [Dactylellina cionopaga]|nr:hypothetical protein ABW20_dc0109195 [Dactylellina cionopaga]
MQRTGPNPGNNFFQQSSRIPDIIRQDLSKNTDPSNISKRPNHANEMLQTFWAAQDKDRWLQTFLAHYNNMGILYNTAKIFHDAWTANKLPMLGERGNLIWPGDGGRSSTNERGPQEEETQGGNSNVLAPQSEANSRRKAGWMLTETPQIKSQAQPAQNEFMGTTAAANLVNLNLVNSQLTMGANENPSNVGRNFVSIQDVGTSGIYRVDFGLNNRFLQGGSGQNQVPVSTEAAAQTQPVQPQMQQQQDPQAYQFARSGNSGVFRVNFPNSERQVDTSRPRDQNDAPVAANFEGLQNYFDPSTFDSLFAQDYQSTPSTWQLTSNIADGVPGHQISQPAMINEFTTQPRPLAPEVGSLVKDLNFNEGSPQLDMFNFLKDDEIIAIQNPEDFDYEWDDVEMTLVKKKVKPSPSSHNGGKAQIAGDDKILSNKMDKLE